MTSPVCAVVVHHETPELALECLRALQPELRSVPGSRAVLVDSGSSPASVSRLRAAVAAQRWEWLQVVESENRGFGAAVNVGVAACGASELVLVANADAALRPGALTRLRGAMIAEPDVGVVGPLLEDAHGHAQVSTFSHFAPVGELVRAAATGPISRLLDRYVVARPVSADSRTAVDWVSFACVLIRGSTFAELGGMDDEYFLYYEDSDFCRRARARGWRVVHEPAARAFHAHGASTGIRASTEDRERRPAHYYASRARYYRKHHGPSGLIAANMWWTAGHLISRGRELVGQRSAPTVERECADLWAAAWGELSRPCVR